MLAHVNGIDIYYEKTGAGRPLLMVHGNGEDHTIFDEAVAVLKDRFTCYCVDSRGHGQSGAADELHYSDMADDMIGLMEQLDLRDVLFYGFSDGGVVGLLAASRCGRVTGLIVSGANVSPKGICLRLRLEIRLMYLFRRDPRLRLMLREPDISDDTLRRITVPTLVLAGDRDLITERETRHIAGTIPGAELRILEGEGHETYIIHRTRIAELILEYAKKTESRR